MISKSSIVVASLLLIAASSNAFALERVEEKSVTRDATKSARLEEVRTKVRQVTDEQKQKTIENIESRLGNINKNWTDHWTNVLTRLSEIVAKVESRGEKLAADGKDTSELNGAIADAKAYILEAQTAVTTQAGKEYSIDISSEETIREDVKKITSQFKTDTRAVFAMVQKAREAVRLAIIEVGQLTGERITVAKEAVTQ